MPGGISTERGFLGSRTTTRRRTNGRPARAARRSPCSNSSRATPLPTVPQPIKAMPSGSISSIQASRKRKRPEVACCKNSARLRSRLAKSRYKLLQEPFALPQCPLAVFKALFIGAVFDFDAHRAVVTRIGECREERAPAHVAQARQLRRVPAESQDAALV